MSSYNYKDKNVLPRRDCKNLLEIADKIKKLDTGNEHLTKAYRLLLYKITDQYCPDDITVEGNMLVIKPCPFHQYSTYDRLIFDPYAMKFRCVLSPTLKLEVDDTIKREILEAFSPKPKPKDEDEEINIFIRPAVFQKGDQLKDLYERNKEEMEKIGLECIVFKNAGIVCTPCKAHENDKFDAIYFDLNQSITWRCAKEFRDVKNIPVYSITDKNLRERITKESKTLSNDRYSFRSEVVARHYLSNNIIKTIDAENGYVVYKYYNDLGYFRIISDDVLKSELQYAYEKMNNGEVPHMNLLSIIRNKVCELSKSGKDLSVFEHDHRDYYYIPFRNVDVMVNRVTREVKMEQKDPINRPFLSALPYDIDSLDMLEPMPPELQELLSLVPPSFRETLLMEIVSPLVFTGSRRIFINYSRIGGTGKSTLLRRLSDLYLGLVAWTEADMLESRFEKSILIGKSAVLIDEFEGTRLSIKRQLKTLASDNDLRIELKNGPILNIKNKLTVIVNTNTLRFETFDRALLQRIIVIPFIRNFRETDRPKEWSLETKIKIIKWLIKYGLPIYYGKEPKRYPLDQLQMWIEKAKMGEMPYDGIEDFLHMYFIKERKGEREVNGKLLTFEEAYSYYLTWTDRVDYIPVSFQEFVERVNYIANRDRAWITDNNKLYIRYANLDFFSL